jgi:PPP family 3-phenylpropionic acid transporter
MPGSVPLALFWFIHLAALAFFFPYYSLYLRENAGLSGPQMGLVLATLSLTGIAAQPFWGYVADRTGARRGLLVLIAIGMGIGFCGLATARGFLWIELATLQLAFFSSAIGSMTVAMNLAALGPAGPRAFGRVRMWGSVGWLAAILAFPPLMAWIQRRRGLPPPRDGFTMPGFESIMLLTAALLGVAALVALAHPRGGQVALRARPGEWRVLLRRGPVLRLCLFTFLDYFFLDASMRLLPNYVVEHGGDTRTIRDLWILMLLVEIPLIWWSGAGLRRLGARGLLMLGVIAGGARWLVCGTTTEPWILYAVQLVHGLEVVGTLLGGPLYMEQIVPPQLRSSAQGLYATFGMVLGGSSSNAFFGWLTDHAGIDAPYWIGGAGGILLGLLAPLLLPNPRRGYNHRDE